MPMNLSHSNKKLGHIQQSPPPAWRFDASAAAGVSQCCVDIAANVMRITCLLFVFVVVCSSYIEYDCWRFIHFFLWNFLENSAVKI